jgi:serine/threonine protein kinase
MSTKADIYSFGKMVKMMVETFYDIRHDYEVVINHHTKDLKHPVEKYYPCKKTLIDLVHKCCNRDPNVRPTAHEIFRLAHTELNSAYMMRLRKSSRSIVLTGERRKDMWVEKRAFQGLRKKKEWYTKNKELCHEVVRLVWTVKPSVRAPPINP